MTDPDSPPSSASPSGRTTRSASSRRRSEAGQGDDGAGTRAPSASPAKGRTASTPAKPRNRLGGPLVVIFWCACAITALPIAGLISLIISDGTANLVWALRELIAGATLSAQVLRLGLLPQVLLFVWGLCVVLLTVARSRHALKLIPALLVIWVVISAWCQIAIRDLMSAGGAGLADITALLPGVMLQIAMAAALWGYFRESERPRLFFTR